MSVAPINVGRPRSVRLVEEALGGRDVVLGVVAQRQAEVEEPTFDDLYGVGTLARVVKVIRLGDNSYSVVLNGLGRFRIEEPLGLEPFMRAAVQRISEPHRREPSLEEKAEQLRARTRVLLEQTPDLHKDTATILANVRDPGALADLVASNFPPEQASVALRQEILESLRVDERLDRVLAVVERQLEILGMRRKIAGGIQEEMSRTQREIALRQQMRSIREQLGEGDGDDEIDRLRELAAQAELPTETADTVRKQLRRLNDMSPQSAEYQIARTYVEWIVELPWSRTTTDNVEVSEVRRCLEEDHYGLEIPKKRIVEYSAIRQLRKDKKGPILLFVGPPGVGKTSLGRSIARAMGRRYGRIALGGVRDEAEIRGHRRTYIGAMPGRILQALKKVGSRNPVLVLDEVDKMGVDLRGDPAAALLEVLDPEQNGAFVDHYLDLPFDLSQVVFLATANYFGQIPEALRDRLEVIELPGYTRTEKTAIAEQFLIPKQLREHGLTSEQVLLEPEGLERIVEGYTREPGVRELERRIASVMRAVTVDLAEGRQSEGRRLGAREVEELLGTPVHRPEPPEKQLAPGVALSLGVASGGGDVLTVEVTSMPGKGGVKVTGNLGKVRKESAEAAVTFVRSKADRLGLDPEWLDKLDLHVHIPRAAYVRDEAGTGLAIFTAVASLMLRAPVRADVAILGELTLRGAVMPLEGVKEQLLAAHRAGLKRVLLPAKNQRDLEELPQEIREGLTLHLLNRVEEVLPLVLEESKPVEPSAPSSRAELDEPEPHVPER